MEQILTQTALDYAAKHELRLAQRLGFGMHGIIFVAEGNPKTGAHGKTAIKIHREAEPYFRERDVYLHLRDDEVGQIGGFNVPHLVNFDDEMHLIEMSIVTRPFVLDFAGAYLRGAPEFSEETWEAWEAEKREQFESRWQEVQGVLAALRGLGVQMIDVTPSNIAFLH